MLGSTDEEDPGFAAVVFAVVKEADGKFAEVFVWKDCPSAVPSVFLTLVAAHVS